MEVWNGKKSSDLYNVPNWGAGYFRVNEKGNLEVNPSGFATAQVGGTNPLAAIDLKELVSDLRERGLRPPLLIRFPDIVNSRVKLLADAFSNSISTLGYKGQYRGVYPIKVNQQRHLVEEIVRFGRQTSLGLEAGSKPELLIALAVLDNPESLLICNGFKDEEYIETALLAQKLGRNTIIVIDRFSELKQVITSARELNIRPRIGFRAKLEAKGAGKWVESSGAKSKFGLTAVEMIEGVEMLKAAGMLSCLELLHFHIGSQITALRAIKDSLSEAARFFVELAALGGSMKYIDVGGGLGVDYDGSQTNWENSMNYTVQEYANDVVSHIQAACDEAGVTHPTIVTEAGRALVAHHSCLIFDVVGAHQIEIPEMPDDVRKEEQETITEIVSLYDGLTPKTLNQSIQDVFQLRDEGMSLFNLGYMSLRGRAHLETAFRAFCTKALQVGQEVSRKPEELEGIRKYGSDNYYCNFSIFQSAPDTWAVGQLFPVVPIHRLNEKPSRRGILLDLTCDSDGKLDKFIDVKDVKDTLELHPLKEGEDYYVGMFLLGAYQEILGDFHNLFGDTDAVHVSMTPMGYSIDHVVEGDSVNEVLSYVEYDKATLTRLVRTAIENALAAKSLSLEESRLLMRYYEDGLSGYTYLDQTMPEAGLTPVEALQRLGQKQIESLDNAPSL